MHSIISDHQSTFISGRIIKNNILIAHELLHSIKHNIKGSGGKMVVRLYMSTAYDHEKWTFVKNMLRALGFNEHWIKIVMSCITIVNYSVLMTSKLGE